MADLDPQVQIKLIEISKEWAEKIDTFPNWDIGRKQYLQNFDNIYKKLLETVSQK